MTAAAKAAIVFEGEACRWQFCCASRRCTKLLIATRNDRALVHVNVDFAARPATDRAAAVASNFGGKRLWPNEDRRGGRRHRRPRWRRYECAADADAGVRVGRSVGVYNRLHRRFRQSHRDDGAFFSSLSLCTLLIADDRHDGALREHNENAEQKQRHKTADAALHALA